MAYGACVQAAALGNKVGAPSMYVRNVTPLTLSVLSTNDRCVSFIKRNTAYPTDATITGRTHRDNQKSVKITLYEGEHATSHGNVALDTFFLTNLAVAPKGVEKANVTVIVDDKGCISVNAINLRTNQKAETKKLRLFNEEEIYLLDRWQAKL